jgi:hypothetical protein
MWHAVIAAVYYLFFCFRFEHLRKRPRFYDTLCMNRKAFCKLYGLLFSSIAFINSTP